MQNRYTMQTTSAVSQPTIITLSAAAFSSHVETWESSNGVIYNFHTNAKLLFIFFTFIVGPRATMLGLAGKESFQNDGYCTFGIVLLRDVTALELLFGYSKVVRKNRKRDEMCGRVTAAQIVQFRYKFVLQRQAAPKA